MQLNSIQNKGRKSEFNYQSTIFNKDGNINQVMCIYQISNTIIDKK